MDRAFMRNVNNQQVVFFPNPNSGSFIIQTSADFGNIISVEIRSMAGAIADKFVYTNNEKYNYTNTTLVQGIYIVSLHSGNNNFTTLLEILK